MAHRRAPVEASAGAGQELVARRRSSLKREPSSDRPTGGRQSSRPSAVPISHAARQQHIGPIRLSYSRRLGRGGSIQ